MKKRFVAMLLAAIMAVSVCACGAREAEKSQETSKSSEVSKNSEDSKSSEVSGVASTSVEEEKPLYPIVEEPITIKGMVVGANTQSFEDRKIWEYVGDLTNIYIEWENVY